MLSNLFMVSWSVNGVMMPQGPKMFNKVPNVLELWSYPDQNNMNLLTSQFKKNGVLSIACARISEYCYQLNKFIHNINWPPRQTFRTASDLTVVIYLFRLLVWVNPLWMLHRCNFLSKAFSGIFKSNFKSYSIYSTNNSHKWSQLALTSLYCKMKGLVYCQECLQELTRAVDTWYVWLFILCFISLIIWHTARG